MNPEFEDAEGNSLQYVRARLEQDKYLQRAERFYDGEELLDPVDLLREYAREIDVSFPEEVDEEKLDKIRRNDDKGRQHFQEMLNYIASEILLEE